MVSATPMIEAKSTTTEGAPRTRRVYSPQEKTDYLALLEQGGLTPADFCREMGLNEATFSLWRRTAREGTGSEESTPTFAEVQLSPSRPGEAAAVTVLLPSGAKIEVSAATDAVWKGLGLMLKTLHF
jgi:transposase-like protein